MSVPLFALDIVARIKLLGEDRDVSVKIASSLSVSDTHCEYYFDADDLSICYSLA